MPTQIAVATVLYLYATACSTSPSLLALGSKQSALRLDKISGGALYRTGRPASSISGPVGPHVWWKKVRHAYFGTIRASFAIVASHGSFAPLMHSDLQLVDSTIMLLDVVTLTGTWSFPCATSS